MDYSPLQPMRFWVDESRVVANAEYEGPSSPTRLPKVSLNIQVAEGKSDDGRPIYHCQLKVNLAPDLPDQPLTYDVDLAVSGFFTFAQEVELSPPEMSRLVAFNGIAMLYGFARDAILQQTSLGPHGPLMLPAVNLTEIAAQLQPPAPPAETTEEARLDSPVRRRTRKKRSAETNPD
ncbi:MAG: protein-export chaperone SecB [Dehalococcoidia bacterium]